MNDQCISLGEWTSSKDVLMLKYIFLFSSMILSMMKAVGLH